MKRLEIRPYKDSSKVELLQANTFDRLQNFPDPDHDSVDATYAESSQLIGRSPAGTSWMLPLIILSSLSKRYQDRFDGNDISIQELLLGRTASHAAKLCNSSSTAMHQNGWCNSRSRVDFLSSVSSAATDLRSVVFWDIDCRFTVCVFVFASSCCGL